MAIANRELLKGRLFCPPDVFAPPTDRELKDLGFE
jgi:hypothetical protein